MRLEQSTPRNRLNHERFNRGSDQHWYLASNAHLRESARCAQPIPSLHWRVILGKSTTRLVALTLSKRSPTNWLSRHGPFSSLSKNPVVYPRLKVGLAQHSQKTRSNETRFPTVSEATWSKRIRPSMMLQTISPHLNTMLEIALSLKRSTSPHSNTTRSSPSALQLDILHERRLPSMRWQPVDEAEVVDLASALGRDFSGVEIICGHDDDYEEAKEKSRHWSASRRPARTSLVSTHWTILLHNHNDSFSE